jgi:hypothetical protein
MTDEEYNKTIKKFIDDERTRRARIAPPPTYNPSDMDREKMPLGCWLWVILVLMAVFYGFQKLLH